MSGFYSKMLINIRNLYFNNSDDMKTILHGIFLDAADVFLNGYTPSYCEENELIPTAQKFVEKFGSTKACETGVTKEAVASAMCNPAALVALMHDSDYDVLKEAFYYAWAKHISGTLAMTEELTEEYVKKYSNPDTPEGKFKSLTDSIKNYKNIRLGLDVNGEIDSVKYPVDGIFNMDAMYDGYLDTWNIATRSEEERIEEFLEENDALLKNRDKIPFKYISDIHYGKKTVWKNPDFEN